MTGYTVHTGSSELFSSGWDAIFKSGAKKKATEKSTAKTPKAAQKTSKPKAKKAARKKKKS